MDSEGRHLAQAVNVECPGDSDEVSESDQLKEVELFYNLM